MFLLNLIVFCFFPLIVLYIGGIRKAGAILALILLCTAAVAAGVVLGLGLTFVTQPDGYFRAYNMPVFWTNEYVNSQPYGAPFINYFAVPYIFVADIIKLVVHFSFTHGTPVLWFCEACGIWLANRIRKDGVFAYM